MRRIFVLIATVIMSMTVGAKDFKFEGSTLRDLTFNVPDGLDCVYNAVDSAKTYGRVLDGEFRYLFTSEEGLKLYVYLYEIANVDIEKATAVPDTVLLPFLKELEIIERIQPVEGELDRIITIKNKDGMLRREYIGFFTDGIISFSAESPSGDFALADLTAKSVDNSFRWDKFLLYLVCIIIAMIPSFFFATAWDERKSNLPKFWKRMLTGLMLSFVIGIVGSLVFGFPIMKSICLVLVFEILVTVLLCMGGTIICF